CTRGQRFAEGVPLTGARNRPSSLLSVPRDGVMVFDASNDLGRREERKTMEEIQPREALLQGGHRLARADVAETEVPHGRASYGELAGEELLGRARVIPEVHPRIAGVIRPCVGVAQKEEPMRDALGDERAQGIGLMLGRGDTVD